MNKFLNNPKVGNKLNEQLECIEKMLEKSSVPTREKPKLTSIPLEKSGEIRVNPFTGLTEMGKTPILDAFSNISSQLQAMISTFALERGFVGKSIALTNVPLKVIDGKFPKTIILQNSSTTIGITSTGTVLASASRSGTGNTQTTSLGVASYKDLRVFLNVSVAGSGTVQVDARSKDPVSGNWVTTQADIFATTSVSPTAVGTYYANLGSFGIDSEFALAYTVIGTAITFSVGYILKEGLGGSGTGLNRTIYLGTSSGLTSVNGFPLLEGGEKTFYIKPNTEVWAVSSLSSGIDLKLFELQ